MYCTACSNAIRPSFRFCPTCGAPLSRGQVWVAGRKRSEALAQAAALQPAAGPDPKDIAARKRAAEGQIDAFLRQVGIADPVELTDEEGWRRIQLGSAVGRAGVVESDGELFLQVDAYIMPLPSDKELIVPLMRELLEHNLLIPGSLRLGIRGEAVFAVSVLNITELQPTDFANCIHRVMTLADEIDDTLVEKYAGTVKKRVLAGKATRK